MAQKFEWDNSKAVGNLLKHGVSFEEGKTVFDDPYYIDFYDPDHSQEEHRYIMVGMSQQQRLLVVSYTERGDTVRLISARLATRREQRSYEHG